VNSTDEEASGDGPNLISVLGRTTVFIGAYLYFLGSVYAGSYYQYVGIPQHAIDLPVNTILFNAYYVFAYGIRLHTAASVLFLTGSIVLLLILSRPVSGRAWLYAGTLFTELVLSVMFLGASYRVAIEAGGFYAKEFITQPPYSVCVTLNSEAAAKMPLEFFDGENRNQRCGLHTIIQTSDLLFLFDHAASDGSPSHVYTLHLGDVAMMDASSSAEVKATRKTRAGRLISQPSRPAAPPPPPPPPPPPRIVLRGVHFDSGKSSIREVDKPILDEAAETLKAHPDVKVYVNGYSDDVGTAASSLASSLKMSSRWAESVAAYLEDKGIPSSQLIVRGFGKTNFVDTNKTEDGRAENRRVELVPVD